MQRRFIYGTTGFPDYLVIAQKGPLLVTIKPVYGPSTFPNLAIGVRVRVVAPLNAPVLNVGYLASHEFPMVKFQKVDASRASLFLGVAVPMPAAGVTLEEFLHGMGPSQANLFEQVMHAIRPMLAIAECLHSEDEIHQYFIEKVSEVFCMIQGIPQPMIVVPMEDPEEYSTEEKPVTQCKVLEFKPKAKG